MRVLITGGCGFIGSNLAEYLVNKGYEVAVLDNLSRKNVTFNLKRIKEKVAFFHGDIRDLNALSKAAKGCDVIVHTAAQVAVTTSLKNTKEDFEINAVGTFNVAEIARKNDAKVVYCSTNKVYGDNVNKLPIVELDKRYDFKDKRGIDENFPISAEKHSPYGISKLVGELYLKEYNATYGMKNIINRMSCIYGVHQFGNEDQGWIAHFVISSIFNRPLTIYGNGKQVRDVLFITDLIELFEKQINSNEKGIFNVGGGKENTLSLLELLELLEEFNPRYSFADWRPADQKVYYSNIQKVSKTFNWKPKVGPQTGVKKLIQWVEENKHYFNN